MDVGPVMSWRQIQNYLGVPDPAVELLCEHVPCLAVPNDVLLLIGQSNWHHLVFSVGRDKQFENNNIAGVALRSFMNWPTEACLQIV